MINKEEVRHIAELARIGIDEEDLDVYSKEMSGILGWVEQLQEVDTDGIEPTGHITGQNNISHEDKVDPFGKEGRIRDLFPEKKDDYDKVKSVL
jgi:aspartyl-tRNA(Asn)/glutamyl-tRNA(Gln) amidotransferase subunit C